MGYRDEPNDFNKNLFPTKAESEACLALSQLCQLRDAYNGEPLADWCDWKEHKIKYVIYYSLNDMKLAVSNTQSFILAFKTEKLRDEFFENFRELIEIAKPLL